VSDFKDYAIKSTCKVSDAFGAMTLCRPSHGAWGNV